TRHARNGQLFTFAGRINVRQARYRDDARPVDPGCGCRCCRRYSLAYLRHLHEQNEPLYGRLATIHNLYFYQQWVGALRRALREQRFSAVRDEFFSIISTNYLGNSQEELEEAAGSGRALAGLEPA